MVITDQREGPVEGYLLKQCRAHGFLCLKFVSPARGGVPDRIIITPTAGTIFVELKKTGGELEPRQRAMHHKMRRFGAEVFVVDSRSSIDALMVRLAAGSTAGQVNKAATSSNLDQEKEAS